MGTITNRDTSKQDPPAQQPHQFGMPGTKPTPVKPVPPAEKPVKPVAPADSEKGA